MSRLLFLLFSLFLFNYSHSQTSDLGRFTVNVKSGCLPLEIEIISENLDSSVSVVQYDFNYNTTNNLFNPSSGKSYTYNSKGKFVIAQAINQDGVDKIDIIEVEAFESRNLDIELNNCSNNSLEININDNYYDGYKLFIKDNYEGDLNNGLNTIDYSMLLDNNNSVEGYIIGVFDDNEKNCSKFNFKIVPIENSITGIIDSVILSDDKSKFEVTYNPEKSTNYEIYLDGTVDSTFFSPSFLYFNHSSLEFRNINFNRRCIKILKRYGCNEQSIEDEICLIYLNVFENEEGINLEYNYNGKFDSISVLRNNNKLNTQNENNFIDNRGIIKNKEYCYQVIGYNSDKKSISNRFCFISNNNFSPIPIPNAFTPNGDGLNDSFKPFPSLVTDYKMSIFNKFGEKVFESFDINIGWDGYFKGKIVQDVYVYVIEFKLDDQLVKVNDKVLLIK
tara:strand:- start:1417 stop:2757 length:1341 start_codon:yes stop_codon:yes gene_type:complete